MHRSGIDIGPDPRTVCLVLALPDYLPPIKQTVY